MGAVELLAKVRAAGFSLTAEGGQLIVRPASRLTDSMRAALRVAKPALLELLTEDRDLSAAEEPHFDPVAAAALARLVIEDARQRAVYAEPTATGYRVGIAVRVPAGGYVTAVLTVPTADSFAILGAMQRVLQ